VLLDARQRDKIVLVAALDETTAMLILPWIESWRMVMALGTLRLIFFSKSKDHGSIDIWDEDEPKSLAPLDACPIRYAWLSATNPTSLSCKDGRSAQ
jgi:hypothetical protein